MSTARAKIVLLLLIVFGIFFVVIGSGKQAKKKFDHNSVTNFDENKFFIGHNIANSKEDEGEDYISKSLGVVLPHHDLAGHMMSFVYGNLNQNNFETIVVLGPNHEELGNKKVYLSDNAWETKFGIVFPDLMLIDFLNQLEFVEVSDEIVLQDQSIFTQMPYLVYYLPETKVVPILISSKVTQEEIDQLALKISELNKVLVIASIDFSHYLTTDMAFEKDEETLKLINEKQYEKILKLNSDYLDCPACMVILMKSMGHKNAEVMQVIGHENSGNILNSQNSPTTSYYTMVFYEEK